MVLAGPDPTDRIAYGGFPNSDDAKADLHAVKPPSGADVHIHLVAGGVPGYTNLPNRMWEGSIAGKSATGKPVINGFTVVEVVKGNVLVYVFNDSVDNVSKGNVRNVLILLKSGLGYLGKVEARLARH